MEKVAVNNQIVSMRKIVKQAKLHIINKLVKQRKMLQLKKGTDAQLEKNKRKEERLGTEINIIKKIPVDEVSRKSLLQLKDWKTVLLSKTVSLEERAFALLANFEPLQAEIKTFIEKNPNLVHLLPDFYEEWNQKKADPMRQEAKRLKTLEIKLKRKERKAKLKKQLSLNSDFSNKFKRKPKASESNRQKNKNVSIQSHFTNVTTPSNEASDVQIEDGNQEKYDETKCSDSEIGKKTLPRESKEILVSKQKKRKEIAVLSLDKLQDQESLEVGNISDSGDDDGEVSEGSQEMADSVENRNVKKDPFFISANESFDIDEKDPDDTSASSTLRIFSSSHEKKSQRKNFHPNFSNFSDKKPMFKQKADFKRNLKQQKFQHGHQRFNETRNKPLNQGMKTKFSPHSRRNEFKFSKRGNMSSNPLKSEKPHHSVDNKLPFESKNASTKKDSGLHPSWEAKRKLKQQTSQLLPFQGKKITFE